MTERLWIVLIVAIVVVLVVFMLRRQLKNLVLKGLGMEAQVETHGPDSPENNRTSPPAGGVSITNFKQKGSRNEMKISRDGVNVDRAKQIGRDQKIVVGREDSETN